MRKVGIAGSTISQQILLLVVSTFGVGKLHCPCLLVHMRMGDLHQTDVVLCIQDQHIKSQVEKSSITLRSHDAINLNCLIPKHGWQLLLITGRK